MTNFHKDWSLITDEIRTGLGRIDETQADELINAILGAEKVFFIAVGRVMLALQAMVKRLAQLGISCHCVGAINEPAATEKDLLIVASGSGESVLPVAIARVAKKSNVKIAWIGSNPNSTMRSMADVFVRIPVRTKLYLDDEIESRQPMTSIFDQILYIFGDAVSMEIIRRKQLDIHSLWKYHANLE